MNYHFPNTLLVYLHDLLQRYRVLFDLRIICENDMIKDTPSEAELQQVQNTVGGLVVVKLLHLVESNTEKTLKISVFGGSQVDLVLFGFVPMAL